MNTQEGIHSMFCETSDGWSCIERILFRWSTIANTELLNITYEQLKAVHGDEDVSVQKLSFTIPPNAFESCHIQVL